MERYYLLDSPHDPLNMARRALERHPEFSQSPLSLTVDGDKMVLRGNVSSYYRKQLAQETVKYLATDHAIQNEIVVEPLV